VRRASIALLALAACSSGADRPAHVESCAAANVWPVNEAQHCLEPFVSSDDLFTCNFPDELQGHGIFAACAISADGGLFATTTGATLHFESDAGWRFSSDDPRFPSTLTPADQTRCAANADLFPLDRQAQCAADGGVDGG